MARSAANFEGTLRHIYILLYLQFVFYWVTIAFGMVVNYYYVVPDTLQSDFFSIFREVFSNPILLTHGVFAFLSTLMSVPVMFLAHRLRMRNVVLLHAGAITARMGGFIGGPLFLYFSTSAIGNGDLSNLSTFVMASAFMLAVTQSFLSRIFIVREDVRLEHTPSLAAATGITAQPPQKKEETGTLGLPGLRIVLDLCYANFVVYLMLYFTGMFVNIYITSGVNTIGIGEPINIVHVVATSLNMAFSFALVVVGFVYSLRKAALFSLGAVASIAVASVGGLVFLATGGGRMTGSVTLFGGWVMSLLFTLAFFLAYYATLRVVRAIRVLELERGVLATAGLRPQFKYWVLVQTLFLALTYLVGVFQALGVDLPGIASTYTMAHAFFAAGFAALTLVVGLMALFSSLGVVALLNLGLFFAAVLGGSAGLAFLGNTVRPGGASMANALMGTVAALGMPVSGFSLSMSSSSKGGRSRTVTYMALGSLSFTMMAGVGVASSAFSASLVPAHVVFAGLTVVLTSLAFYYCVFEGGARSVVSGTVSALISLVFVCAAAGMGAAFLLGGPLLAARGMGTSAMLVYIFLVLSLWPGREELIGQVERVRRAKGVAWSTVALMAAGTIWAWTLDPLAQQTPFSLLISSDLVGLAILAYLWLGGKYGGTRWGWVAVGAGAFLILLVSGVTGALLA